MGNQYFTKIKVTNLALAQPKTKTWTPIRTQISSLTQIEKSETKFMFPIPMLYEYQHKEHD